MNLQIENKNELLINSKLRPFVDSLQKFVHRYEDIMTGISGTLPEIEKQIDDNLLEARELLHFLFSNKEEAEDYGVKKEIVQFHRQLDSILSTLRDMNGKDKEILSNLKDSIEVSNNTVDEMTEIYDISENLKVYAINSIVNSQKAGDSGRGYQIISNEFIRLSEQIASGTKKISGISLKVQDEIREFLEAVERMESFSSEHIKNISTNSGNILKKANESINNFTIILEDFLDRIEQAKSPTYRIMIELQKQDIIHQQLVHLLENINDILVILDNRGQKLELPVDDLSENEKNENRSLFTLIVFLLDNTEHQINRISTEFLEMIEHLESSFSEINSSITDINSDKSEFSNLVGLHENGCREKLSGEFTSTSVVGHIFDSPCILIRDMNRNLNDLKQQKLNILSLFYNLEIKIEKKKDNAKAFIPLIESIKNLLLMSRIEQARYGLDFSIAGSGVEVGFFHDSFEDLTEIISDIENAHSLLIDNFTKTKDSFLNQDEQYLRMEEESGESINVIQKTKEIFIEHFETVMEITNHLVSEISHYTGFLDELRKMNDAVVLNIKTCSEIKVSIAERLESLGGELPLDECHFRDVIYQQIVQKCTVAQERDTISKNFGVFEIEQSDSNNITLF